MKIILITLSLLFVFNFVYSQDSTQKETRYKKGSLLISNNFILGGIATTGDTVPNQLILNYGLKPVLQYFSFQTGPLELDWLIEEQFTNSTIFLILQEIILI